MQTGLRCTSVCSKVRGIYVHCLQPYTHINSSLSALPISLPPNAHTLSPTPTLHPLPSSLAQQQPVVCSTRLHSSLSSPLSASPNRSQTLVQQRFIHVHVCVRKGTGLLRILTVVVRASVRIDLRENVRVSNSGVSFVWRSMCVE